MSRKKPVNPRDAKRKPKLGQNFLRDEAAAERIVGALGDITQAHVIEIGPGDGVLTRKLASKARRLTAIEVDRRLAAKLRMEFARREHVEILEADVLSQDLRTVVQGELRGISDRSQETKARARVVGNLPYYITSDILLKLFASHAALETIVVMVQREVAERLAASPGTRAYGLLTCTARLFTDPDLLFTLPPESFSPPPKVHSSVLRMDVRPKADVLGVDEKAFISFLKICFAQKRKTLWNNLRATYGERASFAIKSAGLRADVRAEAVSLEILAKIFRGLAQ